MHHGLDSIAIANSKFSNTKLISWTLPWEKKQNRSDITSNKGIEIRQYNAPDVPALAAKICSPMIKISFVTVLLTFYGIMLMHLKACSNWSDYISNLDTKNHSVPKPLATMLTFDQPL